MQAIRRLVMAEQVSGEVLVRRRAEPRPMEPRRTDRAGRQYLLRAAAACKTLHGLAFKMAEALQHSCQTRRHRSQRLRNLMRTICNQSWRGRGAVRAELSSDSFDCYRKSKPCRSCYRFVMTTTNTVYTSNLFPSMMRERGIYIQTTK